jgi:hypothetical protein
MTTAAQFNRRTHERFALTPMYTRVEVRGRKWWGKSTQPRVGHIYDISESGARIELDDAVKPGQAVKLRLEMPGAPEPVAVTGNVVWVADDEDDPGPRRMALRFDKFASEADHMRLVRYLGMGRLSRAA